MASMPPPLLFGSSFITYCPLIVTVGKHNSVTENTDKAQGDIDWMQGAVKPKPVHFKLDILTSSLYRKEKRSRERKIAAVDYNIHV